MRVPETARLQLVAGDFFGTLRQRAQIGRLLGPGDNRAVGQHPVAVISDRYWSRRFGRTARVLDTELIINGAPMAVVGVAAPDFFGATVDRQTPDIWAPAAMQAALRFAGNYERTGGDLQKPWPSQPEFSWLQVMLRVPAGAAAAAAAAMTLRRASRKSNRQQRRFSTNTRHIDPCVTWLLADPVRIDDTTSRPAADGRPAARHRVRKHCQPALGARDESRSRDGDSSVHRSRARPIDSTASHREPAVGLHRRCPGSGACRLGVAPRC